MAWKTVAVLALALLPTGGSALAAETLTLGDRGCDYPTKPPAWLHRPTEAQIRAAYPIGAPPKGSTEMICRVGVDGGMHDCRVTAESPTGAGFGAASLKLAADFKMTPPHCADGRPAEGGELNIPMQWKYW